MINGFEKIVEERIRKAQKKGMFKNLPGAGKPIPSPKQEISLPSDLSLSYKILKNADFLPPEIELKKQIQQTEDLLAGMEDTAEKYRTLKKLNYMIMKLNITFNKSIINDIPQQYTDSIAKLLE